MGWLGISPGPVMAAAESFKVRLTGKGGHGASPHLAIDPVVASANIVTALQGIVARNIAPLDAAVISVTTIHGGEAFNVIPQAVEMLGTIRTFLPSVCQHVHERFRQIIEGVASAMECQADVDIHWYTPAVVNEARMARHVAETARGLFADAIVDESYQTMISEDMAFMLDQIPGCFFFVGSANEAKGLNAPHHHPRFDIDEEAMPRAAALMATAVARWLS
jgi:amidohydrolase